MKRPADPGEVELLGAIGTGASRVDTLPDGVASILSKRELAVGDLIGGRYRLELQLGTGAMGQVFVADNRAIGLRVAVKVLRKELLANPDFRRRFQHEAQAIAAIQHANVARFMDLVVGDPTFLVMEYVRGETLSTILAREQRLPAKRAVAIGIRLCWGLDAAHEAGVVHRDLKPDNIMITPDSEAGEVPKIIDFGLAKLAARAEANLTRTGQIVGTPQYMSPEQIRGGEIDARADVYALGCVIYAMIVGEPPFASAEDDVQALFRQMHEPATPASTRAQDVPPALDAVLAKALAKEPRERYASTRDMAAALNRCVEKRGEETAMIPRLPRRTWSWWWLAPALVGLGAAGTAGYLMGHRHAQAPPPAPVVAGSLLVVETRPPGARITLDHQAVSELTPAALRVPAGAHVVGVQLEGYGPLERNVVTSDHGVGLDIAMSPVARTVQVQTVPSGATLYLDGQLVGLTTPASISIESEDFHELRLEKDGFEPKLVAIKPEDKAPTLEVALEAEQFPRGVVTVDSNSSAEVSIDGVPTGFITPTFGMLLPVGKHTIELADATGRRSAVAAIDVHQGENVHVTIDLSEK